MNIFRSIIFASVLAGLCAGLLVSILDIGGTTPLILAAEKYENTGGESHSHSHEHGDGHEVEAGHVHGDAEAWAPADGIERTLFTTVANVLTAIGYAMILTGIFSLRGQPVDWREGLFFGLAGFVSVMLAPAIGLPPELPGTPAGDLAARQIWWVSTVLSTAGGLALIAFVKKPWAAVLALVLLAAPHIYGAPQPAGDEHALAPESLSQRFVAVATVTSMVFWSALGVLSAFFFSRSLAGLGMR